MESYTSQFAIFHFSVDESIEVVPTNWIKEEKYCWYPKEGSKLNVRNSAKKRIQVTDDFIKFEGRIIGHFDSYSDGRKKLPEAQYNSDLDASKPHKLVASTSRPVLPPQPILGIVDHGLPETNANSTPNLMATLLPPATLVSPSTVTYTIPQQEMAVSQLPVSQMIVEDVPNLPTGCADNCAEFRKDVLRKLVMIQETQRVQSEMLEAILNRRTPSKSTYNFEQDFFPISKMEDLESFNQLIKENRAAYDAMVHRLTFDGVGSTEKALKMMLKSTFTDELLCGHNYKGQSNKKCFLNYDGIVGALIDALKDNPRVTDYCRAVFDKAMQTLLKQTIDRVRERKKREEKK